MSIQTKIKRAETDLKDVPETIKITDNGEALQLLFPTDKLLIHPIWESQDDIEGKLYKKYIKENPHYKGVYLRESVLKYLHAASDDLPSDWRLVVVAGHRPLSVQQRLYQFFFDQFHHEEPNASDEIIAIKTRRYVADPSRKVSPHCSGAAVDVCAINKGSRELIDFGTSVNSDEDASSIFNDIITPVQAQNRLILLTAMLKNNFASLQSEW